MINRPLDPVEWEIVRAEITFEKARLEANGDMDKWRASQRETERRLAEKRSLDGESGSPVSARN